MFASILVAATLASTPPTTDQVVDVGWSALLCALEGFEDDMVSETIYVALLDRTGRPDERHKKRTRVRSEAVRSYWRRVTDAFGKPRKPCIENDVLRVTRCLDAVFTDHDELAVVWARTREGCSEADLGEFTKVVATFDGKIAPK